MWILFAVVKFYLFIYTVMSLCCYASYCAESLLLLKGFLWLQQAGNTLLWCVGFSLWGLLLLTLVSERGF